jgi:DNA polymerase-3 subunit gamma/tau
MSWYRTYRPQQIKDLHIKPVREALLRILTLGEFDHAYLLAGPKGTGKTSAARILAKVLNCEQNKSAIEAIFQKRSKHQIANSKVDAKNKDLTLKEPCNACPSCIAITNGSSLTVNEIDAASNRGIDDIRALRERIGFAPADGLMSVYIIDEVHMLTSESFNALLKILEEPPAHVVFVLATTDPQKMPATVISRCTVITYRKATADELTERLLQIANAEKIQVTESILRKIAGAADGSFRDGVKLFEQIAKGKQEVVENDVERVIGQGTGRYSADLLTALLAKKNDDVLRVFEQVLQSGMDGVLFQKEVLTVGHAKLVEFAKTSDPRFGKLLYLLRSVAVPIEPLAPIPWMPFELACLCYVMEGRVEQEELHVLSSEKMVKPETRQEKSTVSRQKEAARTEETKKEEIIVHAENKAGEKTQLQKEVSKPVVEIDIDYATVQSKWPAVLAKVRSRSVPMDGILRATRLIGLDGASVCIEASYQFHKEQLELVRNSTILEAAMEEVFGQPLHMQITLGVLGRPVLSSKDHNISGKVEDEGLVKAAEDAFL